MDEEDESSKVLKMDAAKTSELGNHRDGNCIFRASKRPRIETCDGGSLARFQGIALQQNEHWGAQIYSNHQRIWLRTFKSENDATMAYDGATVRLRSEDSYQYSNFADFVDIIPRKNVKLGINLNKNSIHDDPQLTCTQLFHKELTPSDVGKLNRLVIPKKYAVKHFPCIENDQPSFMKSGSEDVELVFYDKLMKTWKFRYCYCKSSQSFVFTRGWNRFVKDKKLKEKDVITFYTCECPGEMENGLSFFLIDVNYNGDHGTGCINGGMKKAVKKVETPTKRVRDSDLQLGLNLNLGKDFHCRLDDDNNNNETDEFKSSHKVEEKRVILFGAQIN